MSAVLLHLTVVEYLQLLWLLLTITINESLAVTFPKSSTTSETVRANYGVHDEDLGVCLRSEDPLVPCITSSMVLGIESASDVNTFDLGDNLRLIQDPEQEKRIPIGDPREAPTILEAITMYMEPRYLHWDLSDFYPGLIMRVGPTSRGHLQFFLDKRKIIDDRSLSTGRLLLKRTVLPILLGIKLNIAALAPLLIAAFIILLKKIFLMSKFSFILAAISLFLNYRRPSHDSGGSFGGSGLGSFGPKKHIIIERPINHWFSREETETLQPL